MIPKLGSFCQITTPGAGGARAGHYVSAISPKDSYLVTQNGLNAGCVVIVEDTPTHRRLFTHGKNALLFRYDDNSLAECLDVADASAFRPTSVGADGLQIY